MHHPKEDFAIASGIRGVNVTLDHVVMHQAIDDIVCLMFGSTDDEGERQKMTHVNEGVGTDALILSKIFEGVIGMQRVNSHLKLLAITRGMQRLTGLAVDLGQS